MVLSDFGSFKTTMESLKRRDIETEQKTNELNQRVAALTRKIDDAEKETLTLNQAISLLTAAADTARKNAKSHFEKVVTDALQFVTQSRGYEFVIQEKNSKTKAAYEFYIKSSVNGVECLQKPEDANGGGFVDIISTASKYAYLEIFSDPRIMSSTLFYDEPGKMISAEMSIKFAEYLKFLGTHYGHQTIMITHNENLANVADATFVVTKDFMGTSTVSAQKDLTSDLVGIDFKLFDEE